MEQTRRSKKNTPKATKSKKPVVIVTSAIAALLVVGGLTGYIYFSNHFLPGSTVHGLSIGFKSVDQAYATAKELNEGQEIKINTGAESVSVKLPQQYLVDKSAFNKAVSSMKQKVTLTENKNFDQELQEQLAGIQFPEGEPAENAHLVKTAEGFNIQPETTGKQVDVAALQKRILDDLANNKVASEYNAADFYKTPEIKSDNPELLAQKAAMDQKVNKKIHLNINNQGYDIPKDKLMGFINDDGSINVELLANWLNNELGPQYDMTAKGVTFTNVHGQKVKYNNIAGTGWAWSIDLEDAKNQIINAYNSENPEENLTLSILGNPNAKSEINDNYIEVDLNAQMVYLFLNGKQVLATDTITGRAALKGQATPTGFHTILYKTTKTHLKGNMPDGTLYDVPVDYWMPLLSYGGVITQVGLHDADYKSQYFAIKDAYTTTLGSNGCLNLPLAAAKTIYENVYEGFPVMIYGNIYDNSPGEFDKPQENPTPV